MSHVAFDWRVLAFALMPNHYHFVVKLGTPGLSDGMCVLNNRFARASNDRFDRINHCFGQRFWSSHLDTQYYALNSIRYCLWNPPRANVCPEPGDTRWTSYRGSVGLDPAQPVLAVDDLLGMFHTERSRARRVLSDFVSDGRVRCQAPWDGPPAQVSVYSGPEPPSGGVRRPPLAVIAPHWTQFDGVTCTVAVPSSARLDLVDLRRAHARPQLGELARHLGLHADVVRLVVARAVAREEHRRELVERELAVGRRIRRRAVGAEELLLGIALGRPVAAREVCRPSTVASPARRDAAPEPARERLAHVPHARAGRARRTTRAARRRTTSSSPAHGASRLRRSRPDSTA